MKTNKGFATLLLCVSCFISCSMQPLPEPPAKKILGVFDGRTPCRELAKMLEENATSECIKIKWRLTLYSDKGWDGGSYEITGFAYQRGNPRTGNWSLTKGTKENAAAEVIQLHTEKGNTMYFQKMDDNILLFLDAQKNLMVGNRDFSYALNRKGMEN